MKTKLRKTKLRRLIGILLIALMLVSLNVLSASAVQENFQEQENAINNALGSNIVSQGNAVIKGTSMFNCATGAVGSVGDIWWEQMTTTLRQMVPQGNAKIVNLGIVNFESITAFQLAGYRYTNTPIPGNNDRTNKLVNNDVFAVLTQNGNYAKIKVVSYGYDLSIQWVTYRAPLATPILVSPANGQHFFHYPRTTTLSWKPVPGATGYKVEVRYFDTAWKFYKSATVLGLNNTSYKFDFVGDQTGQWRVTAISTNNSSTPSGWWNFDYMTAPKLATPTAVSPANSIELYNYPRTTTLAWLPVPGAIGYTVEVEFYDTKWNTYKKETVTGALAASYTFNFVGKQSGRWRVTALAPTGYKNSDPCAWQTFTYKI